MSDISHIGIAVKDLKKAIDLYASILGSDPDEIVEVAEQKVKVAIFGESNSEGRIELLEGMSETSPISRFIEKRGEGLHHLAILVDDIELKLKELEGKGFRLIDKTPRIGAEGKRIAFVHPGSTGGVLLELTEK